MTWKFLVYATLSFILLSCSDPQPDKEEILGRWKSIDGANLEFISKDSVVVTQYPLKNSNPSLEGYLNGRGTWKFIKDPDVRWWSIELLITSSEFIPATQTHGMGIELFVVRTGSLGGGPSIANLFIWQGDPDADDRYEFVKSAR